ncbi:TPA: restriction endonuclease subunit S [Streptococcus suis]
MPNKDRNIPKRRFKEFENEDAWELRKLGEYSTLITKGTTPRDKSGIGVVNFVKVENLVNGDIIPLQKIQLEEHEGYLKRSQLIENDILFSIAGTLGRTAIVKKSILPANTNQALSIIRGYEFDRNFLVTILRGVVVREFIKRNPTIGAQPNLSLEQVSNLCFLSPCSEEQSAIGTFFSTLDRHITLHQRKLDTLKEQKKTYLKLLFPVKGQTKPALHFQGFEDDWEEVKLGEVVSISSGYTGDATLNNGKYKLTRIETISEGKVDVSRTGFSNELPDEKYRLNFGDILFSNINSLVHIGKVAIFNTMEEVFHGINLLRLVPNKDLINPYFIYYQLVTESKKNWSKAHANQAVNQASINQTSLSTQKISISSLPEQEVIGTFFQNLDQEIAQVEDKLASLKEMKKTLLRKLFV